MLGTMLDELQPQDGKEKELILRAIHALGPQGWRGVDHGLRDEVRRAIPPTQKEYIRITKISSHHHGANTKHPQRCNKFQKGPTWSQIIIRGLTEEITSSLISFLPQTSFDPHFHFIRISQGQGLKIRHHSHHSTTSIAAAAAEAEASNVECLRVRIRLRNVRNVRDISNVSKDSDVSNIQPGRTGAS